MAIIGQLDDLIYLQKFDGLSPVFDFLFSCKNGEFKKKDFKERKRVELGDGIFAMLQTYSLKSAKRAFFESHKRYIDFQMVVIGNECFMMGDRSMFLVKNSYDEFRDITVYYGNTNAHRILSLPFNICIFMPNDVHAGGLQYKSFRTNVCYKAVVKVPTKIISLDLSRF